MLLIVGVGLALRHAGQLAPVHPAEHRRAGARTAGRACCAAPDWSSSPTSASTRSAPRRRRPRTRSATCRSASSASLAICTILYVARVGRADRHGAVHGAQRRRPGGATRCEKVGAPALRARARGRRRGARSRVGDPGDAARPVPRVLLDVARRAARQVGRQRPSQVPDAVPVDDLHRDRRGPRHRRSCRCSCSASWSTSGRCWRSCWSAPAC